MNNKTNFNLEEYNFCCSITFKNDLSKENVSALENYLNNYLKQLKKKVGIEIERKKPTTYYAPCVICDAITERESFDGLVGGLAAANCKICGFNERYRK